MEDGHAVDEGRLAEGAARRVGEGPEIRRHSVTKVCTELCKEIADNLNLLPFHTDFTHFLIEQVVIVVLKRMVFSPNPTKVL